MRESGFIVRSALVLGLSGAAIAGPEVMDFQSLEVVSGGTPFQGDPVIEGSYKVTSSLFAGFNSFGTLHSLYAGSTGLFNAHLGGGSSAADTILERRDGGSFSIQSINLAQLFTNSVLSTPVNFVGTFSGGGTISMGAVLPASGSTLTYRIHLFTPAWTGLSKVTWKQDVIWHQFDEIVLGSDNPAIPLPGGAAMAMVGMGVIGVRRRRN